MAMTGPGYTREFFHGQRGDSRRSATTVVPIVLELLDPASVLDVGCGVGTWLAAFKERGVRDVLGLDGAYVDETMLQISAGEFRAVDLAAPFTLGRDFDLVMSLEVAEHLPEDRADDFVTSLVAHGKVVLFSAAVPHQGGTNHVNEQWPDYWIRRFERHGYHCRDVMRGRLWMNNDVSHWYRQNMLFFVAEELLGEPVWSADQTPSFLGLPLVHPELLVDNRAALLRAPASLRVALRDLVAAVRAVPGAAASAVRRRL
jgi:SAM-dependent methyltransferase